MKNRLYKILSIIFFVLFLILLIISLLIIFKFFENDEDKLFITFFFSFLFFVVGLHYFYKYLLIPLKFIDYECCYNGFDRTFEIISSTLKKYNFIKKYKFSRNEWYFEVFIKSGIKKRNSKCVSIIKTSNFSKYNCEMLINKIKDTYCEYCRKEKITFGEWYLILIIDKYTYDLKEYIENLYIDFIGHVSKSSILLIDFIPIYISLDKKNKFIKIPSFIRRKSKRKSGNFIVEMLGLKEKT